MEISSRHSKNSQESLYDSLEECCLETGIDDSCSSYLCITALFQFPKSYVGFQGHFPARPVLPAIAQLASIRFVISQVLQSQGQTIEFGRTKFKDMVLPEEEVTVTIMLSKESGVVNGEFKLQKNNDVLVSSGAFELKS